MNRPLNRVCGRGHDLTAPDAFLLIARKGSRSPDRRCRLCRRDDDAQCRERRKARRQRMAERYPNGERWKHALRTVEKVYGPHRTWVGFGHPGHRAWTAEMARLAGITLRQTQREVAP